jgi:hypothetical protein
MPRDAHALMQNAHDLGCILPRSVHDDMGTDKVKPVCVRQFSALVPKLRIPAKGYECIVQFAAVGEQLLMSTPLAGVT